ncbi:MAG: DUF896 domain-containing protein [Anaerovoracaceae bacterium]|nr:DUF896 domain-containing protein [Anaerovoracaceae bacterium]
MITDEMIARINELAAKSKTEEGLTKEEKNEQKKLREQYLQSIRENVRSQLERIEFVDDKPKH